MAQRKISIDLPADFLICCVLSGFEPTHALQYFVDHLSFPKMISGYPIDPYRAATGLVYLYGKRHISERVQGMLDESFGNEYWGAFAAMMHNAGEQEQAELEVIARKKLMELRRRSRRMLPIYLDVDVRLKNSGR